jgi:hypothetical protein
MLTSKLTEWRRSVERLFTFSPNIPTDPAEIAKVRAEISMRRNAMETELLKAVGDLETLKAEAQAKRRDARQHQGSLPGVHAGGGRLEVPELTVCTHLANIFARTGAETQRDLIRLVGMLPPLALRSGRLTAASTS